MKWEINRDCQIEGLAEIYEKYLPDTGYLIEVGAYDGVKHSNSLPLIQGGWGALLIEPVSSHFAKLQQNMEPYPWVNLCQKAVGRNADTTEISIRGEWSTIAMDKIIDTMPSSEPITGTETVDMLPLSTICKEQGITSYDLLIIDCEGHDYQALAGADIKHYQPKMIIIELHELSPLWVAHPAVKSMIRGVYNMLHGMYTVMYRDEINTIFVKKSK